MTEFRKWMLRRIFAQLVVQSHLHENNIKEVYKLLHEAVANEFTEDSPIGQKYWLKELHNEVLKIPTPVVHVTNSDDELEVAVAKARKALKK